jgi:hypothetical protein
VRQDLGGQDGSKLTGVGIREAVCARQAVGNLIAAGNGSFAPRRIGVKSARTPLGLRAEWILAGVGDENAGIETGARINKRKEQILRRGGTAGKRENLGVLGAKGQGADRRANRFGSPGEAKTAIGDDVAIETR